MTAGPIVMVHGAWGGSYSFHKVRPLVHRAGIEVFTPSLTGIGERSHLTHPGVCLSTHVQDVVNAILYEDLDDVVLLGFSYGGMVVTGALDHIGDRVSHLVYLDAFVPQNGQSASSIMQGVDSTPPPGHGLGDEWLIPPLPRHMDDRAEMAWSDARRTPQPVGTFTEPVRLSKPLEEWPFSLTYIKATDDPAEAADSAFWQAAEVARTSPSWLLHEIATHHLVPFSHPEQLVAILLDLARQASPSDSA
ncbi:MAG: alpha/beta hydrolase [Actinomycetia bacterium]|nr:alpha/beta hydrolase [Actinomycetes bacterium]MCP4961270.1 alpha/beta hydrolase [Actinomycetes bacterium]